MPLARPCRFTSHWLRATGWQPLKTGMTNWDGDEDDEEDEDEDDDEDDDDDDDDVFVEPSGFPNRFLKAFPGIFS